MNENIENEDLELDEELNVSAYDNAESESDDAERKKGRQPGQKYIQKTAMINLNDTMRIRILENEYSMYFERKTKNDDTDNWSNDGYFCNIDSLLLYVMQICTKEKIFTKQVRDYREIKDLIKEVKLDIKEYAKMINESIRNNDYIKELREL